MAGAAVLGLGALVGCGLPPAAIRGEVITQDRAVGVPCDVRLWVGEIAPLDGNGSPVASARVSSGQPFEVGLDWAPDAPDAGLYWISFECEGYHTKLRAFEWGLADQWQPVLDVDVVWVPKPGMPYPTPQGTPTPPVEDAEPAQEARGSSASR